MRSVRIPELTLRAVLPGLRREVWRLQLEHAEARIEYEKKLNEHRLGVTSSSPARDGPCPKLTQPVVEAGDVEAGC